MYVQLAILIILIGIIIFVHSREEYRPRRVLSDPAHDYDYSRDFPAIIPCDEKPFTDVFRDK